MISKIPDSLLFALDECRRYNDRGLVFWWRRASMQKLAALGLVERWRPLSIANSRHRESSLPYRLTDAGRAVLSEVAPFQSEPSR